MYLISSLAQLLYRFVNCFLKQELRIYKHLQEDCLFDYLIIWSKNFELASQKDGISYFLTSANLSCLCKEIKKKILVQILK